jgi:CRISPR-associated protein (TIGR03984 family)
MTTSNRDVRLDVFARHGLSLQAALDAFAPTVGAAGAVGFTLGPARFSFVRLDATGAATGPVGPADLAEVYEARVFHEHAELRWLRDPRHESGHATVVLTDGSCAVDLPSQPLEVPLVDVLKQSYVLWGEPDTDQQRTPGWTRLSTARIGGLDVPHGNVPESHRVAIASFEYLGEFAHGNVAVVEERLCGLTTFKDR